MDIVSSSLTTEPEVQSEKQHQHLRVLAAARSRYPSDIILAAAAARGHSTLVPLSTISTTSCIDAAHTLRCPCRCRRQVALTPLELEAAPKVGAPEADWPTLIGIRNPGEAAIIVVVIIECLGRRPAGSSGRALGTATWRWY